MQAQHDAEQVVQAIEARLALVKNAAVALAQCRAEELPRFYAELGQHIEALKQQNALPDPIREQAQAQISLQDPIDVWGVMEDLQSGLYASGQRVARMKGALTQYLLDINLDRVVPSYFAEMKGAIDTFQDSGRLTEFFNVHYPHWFRLWTAIQDGIVENEATYFAWKSHKCPANWLKNWRWFDKLTRPAIPIVRVNPTEDNEYAANPIH